MTSDMKEPRRLKKKEHKGIAEVGNVPTVQRLIQRISAEEERLQKYIELANSRVKR